MLANSFQGKKGDLAAYSQIEHGRIHVDARRSINPLT